MFSRLDEDSSTLFSFSLNNMQKVGIESHELGFGVVAEVTEEEVDNQERDPNNGVDGEPDDKVTKGAEVCDQRTDGLAEDDGRAPSGIRGIW